MIFIDNKYTSIYFRIVEQARNRIEYTERHHIIPESFFKKRKRKGALGWLIGDPENPRNKVLLTSREHLICHRLLPKMTTGKAKAKALNGLWAMLNLKGKNRNNIFVSSRTYAKAREEFAIKQSLFLTGYKQKPEQGQKISAALKGRKSPLKGTTRPLEIGMKISLALTGISKTEEHIQHMRETHVGFAGKTCSSSHREKPNQKLNVNIVVR